MREDALCIVVREELVSEVSEEALVEPDLELGGPAEEDVLRLGRQEAADHVLGSAKDELKVNIKWKPLKAVQRH